MRSVKGQERGHVDASAIVPRPTLFVSHPELISPKGVSCETRLQRHLPELTTAETGSRDYRIVQGVEIYHCRIIDILARATLR